MASNRKYGVNTFINEVHVKEVDFDGTFRKPEYKYIVEIVPIYDRNSNGYDHMKIYTDGELEVFNIGNWKISPIITLPYNWTGYRAEIEMSDLNSNTYTKKARPDNSSLPNKQNLIPEIKWVFETIKSMENIENCDHLEILDFITETNSQLSIYKNKGVDAGTFQKHFDRLKILNDKYKTIKATLTEINSSILMIKINESIELYNTLMLNKIV